jgi:hypothetical protein
LFAVDRARDRPFALAVGQAVAAGAVDADVVAAVSHDGIEGEAAVAEALKGSRLGVATLGAAACRAAVGVVAADDGHALPLIAGRTGRARNATSAAVVVAREASLATVEEGLVAVVDTHVAGVDDAGAFVAATGAAWGL